MPRECLREEIRVPSQGLRIALALVALTCFAIRDAPAQSFNCRKATKADEIAICHSARLAPLDEQLSSLFFKLRNNLAIAQQKLLTSEQQTWLRERATCGSDASCIEKVYEKRLGQLGSPVDSGGSNSTVYQQPDMLAMLKYDGTKVATLQYGELVIAIDSEASKSDPTNRIPFVNGHSNDGAVKFAIYLEGDEDVGQEQPNAQVRLIKLDTSSRQPQLIFTYNWGGAHCCTITKIATVDGSGNWHIVDGGILDGDGYEFLDLDRNGGGELVGIDNSAFCSYACSYAPTRVKELTGSELKDVTTDGEYQEFLRYQLRRLETNARTPARNWMQRPATCWFTPTARGARRCTRHGEFSDRGMPPRGRNYCLFEKTSNSDCFGYGSESVGSGLAGGAAAAVAAGGGALLDGWPGGGE